MGALELADHSYEKEIIIATPAISDGMIVVRTRGGVYGISNVPWSMRSRPPSHEVLAL